MPNDQASVRVVPLYKGKGYKCACIIFRGISLANGIDKVYGKLLIRRIREDTERVICDEHSGFTRKTGCMFSAYIIDDVRVGG